METGQNTGWRKLPSNKHLLTGGHFDATRSELFKAKDLSSEALGLSRGSIAILTALISFFKEPLNGRLIVWPSNESLSAKSGFSERSIRLAVRELISQGLLLAKDSANGKRFAIRFGNGQIKDAFGFDLSPLIDRLDEFKRRVAELRARRLEIKAAWDELTVCRRTVEQVIRAFEEHYAEVDIDALRARYADLRSDTPKRSTVDAPGAALAEWSALKSLAESKYDAACAGQNYRHIEDNKNSFDQSCQNGNERVKGRTPSVTATDLRVALPDAMVLTNGEDPVRAAARMRGTYGTSRDAWDEATTSLGAPRAALAFLIVLQLLCDDRNNKSTIRNFGGLFRATVRKVAAGELDLVEEIHKMKRQRRH
jgi:replication initiation protein RepC